MTTKEVSRIAKVSLRQLQWWDEQGYVTVPVVGKYREYTPEDLLKVRILAAMRKKNLAPCRLPKSTKGLGRYLLFERGETRKRCIFILSGDDPSILIEKALTLQCVVILEVKPSNV